MMLSNSRVQRQLYGRQESCELLLEAYERVTPSNDDTPPLRPPELVLIQGHSGTGKTSLAHSLIERVNQDAGFFLEGKFELTALQNPYAVFESAFQRFANDLLAPRNRSPDEETRLQRIKDSIQEAVRTERRLFTSIMPSLELLLGPENDGSDNSEVRGAEALNRFQFSFCKLCHAISAIGPLVLFLDDMQWSDAASLDLVLSMLQSRDTSTSQSSILVIGAFRDANDPDTSAVGQQPELPLHRHLKVYENLATAGYLSLTKIEIGNLNEVAIRQLAVSFLDVSPGTILELGRMIAVRSNGNPFHALHLLRILKAQGHLDDVVEQQNNSLWGEGITSNPGGTADELVHQKLATLSALAKRVLQHAACMGDEIDVLALVTVMDGTTVPDIEQALDAAKKGGQLAFVKRSGCYRFAHDSMRQAALSTVDDESDMMFQIGYTLWRRSSPMFVCTKLFLIVNLLNNGVEKLSDRNECIEAANLNLEAGGKAIFQCAFQDSSRFLRAGIDFLTRGCDDHWKEQYELALSLFNTAIDSALCNQDYDYVSQLAATVINQSHSINDSLCAFGGKISALGQQGQVVEATQVGLEVLRQLGERLPKRDSFVTIVREVMKTKLLTRWRSDDSLLAIPPLQNPEKLAAMHILTTLLPYTFQAASVYTPIIGTSLVRLMLKHGMHKKCSLGLVCYAWVLSITDRSEGYRLGKLALSIVERNRAKELMPRVHLQFYGLISHWSQPLKESIKCMQRAETVGMEIGDVECAMFALHFKCCFLFRCGLEFGKLETEVVEAIRLMELYKQRNMIALAKMQLQYIYNMTGRAVDTTLVSGEAFSVNDPSMERESVRWVHSIYAEEVAYSFGNHSLAEDYLEKRKSLKYQPRAAYAFARGRFNDALIRVAGARRSSISRRENVSMAKKALKQLKGWAKDCPENFLCLQLIVEAEMMSLKGPSKRRRVLALYEEASEIALEENYLNEAAMANELAGGYLCREGNPKSSSQYWEKSRQLYLQSGATAKADQLSQRMREI